MNRAFPWLRHPWTVRIAAWILGATFLAAALPKLVDPPGFAEALHAYKLLPAYALAPMALTLPWLELLMAVALIAGIARRSAGLLSLLLLLSFMVAISINLWRSNPIDCGCFGTHVTTKSVAERLVDMRWNLLRDGGLALLALLPLLGPRKWKP